MDSLKSAAKTQEKEDKDQEHDSDEEDDDFVPDDKQEDAKDEDLPVEKEDLDNSSKPKRKRRNEGDEGLVSLDTAPPTREKKKVIPPPKAAPTKGLGSILSSLNNKSKKMTTMQKTALDWKTFKEDEGIEEELKQKAQGGYLDKQAFLSRTDWRQFENEKAIRAKKNKQ